MSSPALFEQVSASVGHSEQYYDSDGKETRLIEGQKLSIGNLMYQRARSRSQTGYIRKGYRNATTYHHSMIYCDYPEWTVTERRSNGKLRAVYKGTGQYQDSSNPIGAFLGIGASSDWKIAYDPNTRNRTITECLVKLNNQQLELGTNILESKQTLGMIASRSLQAGRLVLAAKRGDWNAIRRTLGLRGSHVSTSKRTADNFLEYSFGWAPLIADIHSGVTLFRDGLADRPHVFSVVRNAWKEYKYTGQYTYTESPPAVVKHRCKLYVSMPSDSLAMLKAVGLVNPAAIAWEAVPFSFVVDWFMPIGNMLDGLSARIGVEFYAGYIMAYAEGSHTVKSIVPYGGSSSYTYSGEAVANYRWKLYRRDRFTDLPFPRPYVKNPLSTRRAALAAALVRQLWR